MLNSIGIIEWYILFHEISLRERDRVSRIPSRIRLSSATRNSNTRKQSRQRSADCQVLHDPHLARMHRRLRARSGVFIGAVNSSRNPVTLSPPSLRHTSSTYVFLLPVRDTRAYNTDPLLHRDPERFNDSAISCSSPQLFPRRSSFSSPHSFSLSYFLFSFSPTNTRKISFQFSIRCENSIDPSFSKFSFEAISPFLPFFYFVFIRLFFSSF